MRQGHAFSPGWLREEIGSALQEVTQIQGISEGLRQSFQDVRTKIDNSETLRRVDDHTESRRVKGRIAKYRHQFGVEASC